MAMTRKEYFGNQASWAFIKGASFGALGWEMTHGVVTSTSRSVGITLAILAGTYGYQFAVNGFHYLTTPRGE